MTAPTLGSLPAVATPQAYVSLRMPKGGRWDWYREGDGGRDWQPMTTLLKQIDTDRYNLDLWLQQNILIGTALREDVRLGAAAIGKRPAKPLDFTKDQRKTLNSLVKTAAKAAVSEDGATLGTAMHDATERVDRGEDVLSVSTMFPPVYRASLQAYEALVRLNGWEVVEIERTVRMTELDAAGTFDRLYRIPGYAGLVVGDVKTEGAPLLNLLKICAQEGGYANGDAMWEPGTGWVPIDHGGLEAINRDVGVLVHVRDGDAVPYLVNLRAGYEAAKAAAAQRDRLKAAKRELGTAGCWAAPMPVKRPAPAEALVAEAVRNDYANPARPDYAVGDTVTVGGLPFIKHADPFGASVDVAFGTPPAVTDTATFRQDAEPWRNLVAVIWQADTREDLAVTWQTAGEVGVPWVGAVKQAGEARLRQIDCPHRALHSPATTSKCACGWTREVRP